METALLNAKDVLIKVDNIKLVVAINLVADFFYKWGLISDKLQLHLSNLKEQDALAVKATGAGKNGYVLSLWDKIPDDDIALDLLF